MTSTTYRAAYWLSDDNQGSVRLTTRDQACLSDADLMDAAECEAAYMGFDLSGGNIVIGDWTE